MLEITPTERIVHKFLINYSFANKSIEDLYEIVKSTYPQVEMSLKEFEEAFNMLFLSFAKFDHKMRYSSMSKIVLFRATTAEIMRIKAFKENLKTLKNAPTIESSQNSLLYDDIRSEALYDSLKNQTDYTLKLVSANQSIDKEIVVYHATYAELQDQMREAAKLIENAGKRYI